MKAGQRIRGTRQNTVDETPSFLFCIDLILLTYSSSIQSNIPPGDPFSCKKRAMEFLVEQRSLKV